MTEENSSLTLVRTLQAPIEAVYGAWIDPEKFSRWMSSPGVVARTPEMDARVGGKYRVEVRVESTGELHITDGEYLEVIPNRKIVKTWRYTGDFKQFVGKTTKLTVEFREIKPGATELTLKHENLPSREYFDAVNEGWAKCLDQLEALQAKR
jgi:uncharacterized protein YndB with AHSA1/START domain